MMGFLTVSIPVVIIALCGGPVQRGFRVGGQESRVHVLF
jgi:hypothetical protein